MSDISWRAKNIGTIASLLSADQCDDYIRFGEATGFAEAPVSTSAGMVMMKDVRNNDRVMIDDAVRAQALYEILSVHLALRFQKKWTPAGLNERLRLYRYDIGQKFDWHRDGCFERDNGERSHFTFMIYLNDDFEGGATSFCDICVIIGQGLQAAATCSVATGACPAGTSREHSNNDPTPDYCCPAQATRAYKPHGNCFWVGTAPFCNGRCPAGFRSTERRYAGDGQLCMTGSKAYCCPLQ